MPDSKLNVAIWSNALFIKTGLSRNAKALLKEFYKSKKYNLFHYCSGISEADPRAKMYPWKTVGCLPQDPAEMARLNKDPHQGRLATYGNYNIAKFVEENEIDVLIASDDLWAIGEGTYNSSWAKDINFLSHVTLDSLPLIDSTKDLAMKTRFYSWAGFGEAALKEELAKSDLAPQHEPKTIHGAVESECYAPISKIEKKELRKKFGIDEDCKIFFYLGRNQLRKKFDSLLQAFASYKKQWGGNSKVFIHTSWTEGWPLERIIKSLGIDNNDVLTTYVCAKCKELEIKPYSGENQDCSCCGQKGSQSSANIANGVSDDDMKKLYGISDAAISLFTSGGQELFNIESMFCGLPLATIGYSCGSDYTDCKDVFEVKHTPTRECNSAFIKAEPNINSVVKFMKKIDDSSDEQIRKIGNSGRAWALERFDSKVIAAQWMNEIDQLPKIDHSKIRFLDGKKANPSFVPDFNLENETFVKHLYEGFLDTLHPDDEGMKYWQDRILRGEPKENIAKAFQSISAKEARAEPVKIDSFLLDNDKKNLFFVMRRSLGDCILSLSLLEGARISYPDHNINIVTESAYFSVFEGSPFVDNLIPFSPVLENEVALIGSGKDEEDSVCDVFIYPATSTQKYFNYYSNSQPEMLESSKNIK